MVRLQKWPLSAHVSVSVPLVSSACVRACVRACARALVRVRDVLAARVRLCMCVGVPCAGWRAGVRVRACVRLVVHACVRVCTCVGSHAYGSACCVCHNCHAFLLWVCAAAVLRVYGFRAYRLLLHTVNLYELLLAGYWILTVLILSFCLCFSDLRISSYPLGSPCELTKIGIFEVRIPEKLCVLYLCECVYVHRCRKICQICVCLYLNTVVAIEVASC